MKELISEHTLDLVVRERHATALEFVQLDVWR